MGLWAAETAKDISECLGDYRTELSKKRNALLDRLIKFGPEAYCIWLKNEDIKNPIDYILEVAYVNPFHEFGPSGDKELLQKIGFADDLQNILLNKENLRSEKRKKWFFQKPKIGVLVCQEKQKYVIKETFRYFNGKTFVNMDCSWDEGKVSDTSYFKGYKQFQYGLNRELIDAKEYYPHEGKRERIETDFEKQLIQAMQKNWEKNNKCVEQL